MRDVIQRHGFYAGQAVGVCAFRGGFTEATVTAVQNHTNHLGGKWSTLTLRLPDGETVDVDTRSHVFVGPEYHETAWCPECRSRQEVEDKHDESEMTRRGEVGYFVRDLSCGHSLTAETGIVGPAPGAPYAGPQVAVAHGTRPRDLRAARARQAQIDADPWGE